MNTKKSRRNFLLIHITDDVIPVDGVPVVEEHILRVALFITTKEVVVPLADGVSSCLK